LKWKDVIVINNKAIYNEKAKEKKRAIIDITKGESWAHHSA